MSREQSGGSRFLYEPFDAANARIDAQEAVLNERWLALERRLGMIEASLERLERRLWLAVYGVLAVVLTRGIATLLEISNS
ncbi:hypothetical protein BFP76_07395 [Amylibacter kogurei]|uniref:Gene transfer agent protein n=1 Tax=Paramylibacter kogurei TaxID=1889778 RepID=A0A2G5K611_9RHOB|nr:hypothetical protein [Amylibacter kogurei]PIB24968.1 hypothetical protein BFP76_07395 [Amylibacter kogurei]